MKYNLQKKKKKSQSCNANHLATLHSQLLVNNLPSEIQWNSPKTVFQKCVREKNPFIATETFTKYLLETTEAVPSCKEHTIWGKRMGCGGRG